MTCTEPTLAIVLDELRQLRQIVETRLTEQKPTGRPLSIADAAKALGVSQSFLRKATADGRIRPTRQGRRVLISPEELARVKSKGIPSDNGA